MKKNPEKTAASKLAPIFSGFFFCVLRTLAELTLRGLPLGWMVSRLWPPFFLRQKRAGFPRCERGDGDGERNPPLPFGR